MAANRTQEGIRLILVSLADGRTESVPVGCYLASFDPEAADGNGAASWTDDPTHAMTFETAEAAAACYHTVPHSRPLRTDGKPNRPLTIFNVLFE